MTKQPGRSTSPIQAQGSGRTLVILNLFRANLVPTKSCRLELLHCRIHLTCFVSFGTIQESNSDDVAEVTSKLSTFQLERVSSSPALKLPQLFNLTSNSSGKGANMHKRPASVAQSNQIDNFPERKSVEQPLSNNHIDNLPQGLLSVPGSSNSHCVISVSACPRHFILYPDY